MDDQEGPGGVGVELEWGGKKWEGSSVNRVEFRQKDDGGWITWPGMCIEGKMPVWGVKVSPLPLKGDP